MYAVIIFAVLLVLVGVTSAVTNIREKQRTKWLAALAERAGFAFQAKADSMAVIPSGRIKLFTRGDSRKCLNVMWQTQDDITVTHWDFTYSRGYYSHARDYTQTVTMFQSPRIQLPQFTLASKDALSLLDELRGAGGIAFNDDPSFSQTHVLDGEPELVIRLFNAELRRFFESHPTYSVEGSGHILVVFFANKRLELKETEQELKNRRGIFRIFESALGHGVQVGES